jgi:hypothetical protein
MPNVDGTPDTDHSGGTGPSQSTVDVAAADSGFAASLKAADPRADSGYSPAQVW